MPRLTRQAGPTTLNVSLKVKGGKIKGNDGVFKVKAQVW